MPHRTIICIGCLFLLLACSRKPSGNGRISTTSTLGNTALCKVRHLDQVVRGLPETPRTLDPQVADDEYSFQVLRDVYEGLTQESDLGKIIPGIAKSWSTDHNGTRYTFRLRKKARWSDGTPVTAEQFVYGLRRAVNPKTASGSAELLQDVKGAKSIIAGKANATSLGVIAANKHVLVIQLSRPAPYILEVLSQPIAAPVRSPAHDGPLPPLPDITDGPYFVAKEVYGSYIELDRNKYYWDVRHVAIPKVRYVITHAVSSELADYLAGEIDVTYSLPLPDLRHMLATRRSQVQIAPILATFYLAFNMSEPQLAQNRYLRKALSMGIDRRLIANELMEGVTPAFSFIPPEINDYRPPIYSWATWNRARRLSFAKKLLSRANLSNKRHLKLRLYFNNDQTIERVVLAVANNWEQNLGISVQIESDEFRVFLSRRKDRNYWDIARFGWNADYNDAENFLDVFARDSPQNDAAYKSTTFNRLLDDARDESNLARRRQQLEQAESVLLHDYVVIPVYFYNARRLVSPCIGGATITPMNHTYSKYLFWRT
jgi:oligopeptide transport system substrate-binding protein